MTVGGDLPEAEFAVLGTVTTLQEGALCTIKAGSRVAKVWDGSVVVHPDDPPMLIRWNGTHEKLELTSDGAIALPPIPAPEMTISQVVRAMFDMEGIPYPDEHHDVDCQRWWRADDRCTCEEGDAR